MWNLQVQGTLECFIDIWVISKGLWYYWCKKWHTRCQSTLFSAKLIFTKLPMLLDADVKFVMSICIGSWSWIDDYEENLNFWHSKLFAKVRVIRANPTNSQTLKEILIFQDFPWSCWEDLEALVQGWECQEVIQSLTGRNVWSWSRYFWAFWWCQRFSVIS